MKSVFLVFIAFLLGWEMMNAQVEEHKKTHSGLEAELEMYPLNGVHPKDPVIKNEAMIDYHRFFNGDRELFNVRFFADANTHWAGSRDMKDLILYTEAVYGMKNFQLAFETGTVTGREYIGVGINYTTYDTKIFRRLSVVSRGFPDRVLGYEFTTQELHLVHGVNLSSTGTSRVLFIKDKTEAVVQLSAWFSLEKIHGFYLGAEYEYNTAVSYNGWSRETPHELFFGIKLELH